MINLRDWLSKQFSPNYTKHISNAIDLLYFKHKGYVPESIYDINTRVEWAEFYKIFDTFCEKYSLKRPSIITSIIVSFPQLISHDLMESLYYIFGYELCIFIFLECVLFIKWDSDTFIQLSDFNSPEVDDFSHLEKYKKVLVLQGNGYNNIVPLKMHSMLYKIPHRKDLLLLKIQSPEELRSRILATYVGQNITEIVHFGKQQMKLLKIICSKNPELTKCESILNSIFDKREKIVPVTKVIIFVTEVIKISIPNDVFGPKKYFKNYLRNVEHLLKFTKNQEGNLGVLLKGVTCKSKLWKKNLTAKFALWIFQSFIIRLIGFFFYVSDIDKGNSLVFIKKNFWLKYMKEALGEMLLNKQLIAVSNPPPNSRVKQLRFLPKLSGSGYRPVIRKSAYDVIMEDKLVLCNTFLKQLIATKCNGYPNHINDMHKSWTNYITNKRKCKSYFVKTDIKDAYGSIIHDKLKSILNLWYEGLPENLQLICFTFKGRFGRNEYIYQFVNLQPSARNKILQYVPGQDKIVSLLDLKSFIYEYIDNIFLSTSTSKLSYRLVRGLHQGGKLSASLCEVYYSAFDEEHLNILQNSLEGDIFHRAVDDYIFVSKSKERVEKFLGTILVGNSDYGVEIQFEKTISNIEHYLLSRYNSSEIPYFGYILDFDKGIIKPNMEKYKGVDIKSSLFLKTFSKCVLENKLTYIRALKLNKLVLDPAYQTRKVLYENIHTASSMMALKFAASVHFLSLAQVKMDEEFMIECILKGINALAQDCSQKGKPALTYHLVKKTCMKSIILFLKKKKCFSDIVEKLQKKERNIYVPVKRAAKIIKFTTKKIHPCLLMSYNTM